MKSDWWERQKHEHEEIYPDQTFEYLEEELIRLRKKAATLEQRIKELERVATELPLIEARLEELQHKLNSTQGMLKLFCRRAVVAMIGGVFGAGLTLFGWRIVESLGLFS